MFSSASSVQIGDVVALLTLVGAMISVYISLVSKVHALEAKVEQAKYSNQLLVEQLGQYSIQVNNVEININRLDRAIELHLQQYISDKDIALSHRHSLQELIQHRSRRWEVELNKANIELKNDVDSLDAFTKQTFRDIDTQLHDITQFLIKTSEFNKRNE